MVTIAEENFERWLDCTDDDSADALTLLAPPEPGEFLWHEVSTRVNRAANDDAQLILPVAAAEAEAERQPQPARMPRKRASAAGDDGQGSLF